MTDTTCASSRVNIALAQRIMGNVDLDYKAIVCEDGHNGKLFDEVYRECYARVAKCKWVSNETICKIMRMPPECACLICNIIGTSLVVPICVLVTRFMIAPTSDARFACLFASVMNGSTIRIAHDHDIVTVMGDAIVLFSGNYTIPALIAILAGAMWREGIDEIAFRKFAISTSEYETIYHIRKLTRERATATRE